MAPRPVPIIEGPRHESAETQVRKKKIFRARRIIVTINNPTFAIYNSMRQQREEIDFAIGQIEKGKEGTVHIQAYLEFKKAIKGVENIKNKFPFLRSAHIEGCKGGSAANIKYVTKKESALSEQEVRAYFGDLDYGDQIWAKFKYGEPKKGGKRALLVDYIKELVPYEQLAKEDPQLALSCSKTRYSDVLQAQIPERNSKPEVIIIYGPTGSGKSQFAANFRPLSTRYWAPYPGGNGVWWVPFYSGEDIFILDDFKGAIPLTTMMRLLDSKPMKLQIKGSFVKFTSKTIIITANSHPKEWWPVLKEKKGQEIFQPFYRRIKDFGKIYLLEKLGEPYKEISTDTLDTEALNFGTKTNFNDVNDEFVDQWDY